MTRANSIECPHCHGTFRGPVRPAKGIRPSHPVLIDAERLRSLYSEHSTYVIAQMLGVSRASVSEWMKRHGIPALPHSEACRRGHITKADTSHGRNRQMVTAGRADGGRVRHTKTGAEMPRRIHTGA